MNISISYYHSRKALVSEFITNTHRSTDMLSLWNILIKIFIRSETIVPLQITNVEIIDLDFWSLLVVATKTARTFAICKDFTCYEQGMNQMIFIKFYCHKLFLVFFFFQLVYLTTLPKIVWCLFLYISVHIIIYIIRLAMILEKLVQKAHVEFVYNVVVGCNLIVLCQSSIIILGLKSGLFYGKPVQCVCLAF